MSKKIKTTKKKLDITKVKVGVKYDGGKVDLSLIPYEVLVECAYVLMHGAKKYGPYNWQGGMDYTRLDSAAMRHRGAFMDERQKLDKVSECEGCIKNNCLDHSRRHHIAAVIVNYMFLLSYELNNQHHLDNRRPLYKGKK
jgi:hypothetical protein